MNRETMSGQRATAAEGNRVRSAFRTVWREERLWLILSIFAGIAIGTPFLLAAGVLWGIAPWYVIFTFVSGGAALLVGPCFWQVAIAWRLSRRPAKEEGHSDVQQ